QSDFTRDTRLENGYYSCFLEQFKNEHGEKEFLIKQFNEIISGNDKEVENLQLAFSNVLNLKKNFLQLDTSKNERDSLSDLQDLYVLFQNHINSIEADKDIKYFDPIKSGVICVYNLDAKLKRKIFNKYMDYLTKKISIPVNDTSSLYISSYIEDILAYYTNFNSAPLCNNLKKPEISPSCKHEERIQCEIYQIILNHMEQSIWSNSYKVNKISEQQYTSDT
ncbi:19076_t:CDS:2, partial [Racocetra persica]